MWPEKCWSESRSPGAAGSHPPVEERPLTELDAQLRRWAAAPIEMAPDGGEKLLQLVERFETDGRSDDARRLAQMRVELGRSPVPADKELGRRLDIHYRNANLRIALSGQLIDRLLPEPTMVQNAVDDTILGTPVRGRSTTSTQLHVRLLPSPQRWQFMFEAAGNVDSQTSSTYGPVTFLNRGAAQFCVQKRILVDLGGIHAAPAAAAVDSNSTVADMQTDYDNIPLLRSMVRNYAMSQREQMQDQANQEAGEKIRRAACWRMDSQVEPRLAKAEANFRSRLLLPIQKLGLNPVVDTLETTEARLTVRTRLAGDDQLAAYTPRPDAPADSLASMQLHESVLNNALDRLDLAGRTFTLPELHRHLNEKLSRTDARLPDDLPEGVEIAFAKSEPLRIRCLHEPHRTDDQHRRDSPGQAALARFRSPCAVSARAARAVGRFRPRRIDRTWRPVQRQDGSCAARHLQQGALAPAEAEPFAEHRDERPPAGKFASRTICGGRRLDRLSNRTDRRGHWQTATVHYALTYRIFRPGIRAVYVN